MKRLYINIVILLATCSFVSCADWLDIEPDGQATNDKLTETGSGYRTMLSGIYKAMTSANLYGTELQFGVVDCLSQQYTWSWNNSGMTSRTIYQEACDFNYYNVQLREKIDAIWKDGYNVIANANNLIQNIEKEGPGKFSEGEMERKLILGEAYACRAMMHFDLCRLFAPAPVEHETGDYLPYVDSYPNIQPDAIGVDEFLQKVVDDLKKAQDLTKEFDESPLGMSANASGKARFYQQLEYAMEGHPDGTGVDDFFLGRGYRLNYYAITALLARVYQYMGQEQLAFECADQVLKFKAVGVDGTTTYDMFSTESWTDLTASTNENCTDLKVISNLILALYNEDSYNDYDLGNFFEKRSDQGNSKWLVVDVDGQEIFKNSAGQDEKENDYRFINLLFQPEYQGFTDDRYRLSAKWYCSEDVEKRDKNMQTLPLIRATEMRYIMAEYYAHQGNFQEAYNILNTIRSNRGVYTSLNQKNSWEDFEKDLVRDAQREWISEGQLFYLYKRLGAKVKLTKKNAEGQETTVVRKLNKSEYMLPIPDNQNM